MKAFKPNNQISQDKRIELIYVQTLLAKWIFEWKQTAAYWKLKAKQNLESVVEM